MLNLLDRIFKDGGMQNLIVTKNGTNVIASIASVGGITHEVSLNEKVRYEIWQWIDAICFSDSKSQNLRQFSEALSDAQNEGSNVSMTLISRTVRMLLLLDKIGGIPNTGTVNSDFQIPVYVPDEISNNEELQRLITNIKSTFLSSSFLGNKKISLLLIIVLAIAESQCEFACPVLWEAYSAARARNELEKRWNLPNTDENFKNIAMTVIDIVCLFIRFQSAPGQQRRATGNNDYMNQCEKIADEIRKRDFSGLEYNKLIDCMLLIGIIEDARNSDIRDKQEWENTKIGNVDITLGTFRPLGLKPTVHSMMNLNGESNPNTWCFSDWLKDPNPVKNEDDASDEYGDLSDFKDLFIKSLESGPDKFKFVGNDEDNSKFLKKYVAYSFGRSQFVDLKNVLRSFAHKAIHSTDFAIEFSRSFVLQNIAIPPWMADGEVEYVLEISLTDEIQAENLVFPQDRTPIVPKPPETTTDAGGLFLFLFGRAKEQFGTAEYAIQAKQDFYMPVPLMKRMLDAVYRLRPSSCLTICMRFDNIINENIHIPRDIDKRLVGKAMRSDPDIDKMITLAPRFIAKYIHGFVLNRAMSMGFESCDIGIGDLQDIDKIAQDHEITMDKAVNQVCEETREKMFRGCQPDCAVQEAITGDSIQKVKWGELLQKVNQEEYLDKILGDYLMKYNTKREAVEKRPLSDTRGLVEIGVEQIQERVNEFLQDLKMENRLFLGIDIGGTMIKFRFFEMQKGSFICLRKNEEQFAFRILTTLPGSDQEDSAGFTRRIVQAIRDNINAVAGLADRVKETNSVAAVGITWPGAVRDNRIFGYSGILRHFKVPDVDNPGAYRTLAVKNTGDLKVQDYWRFSVVEDFREAWYKSFNYKPSVTLINDGDAEATGVTIKRTDISPPSVAIIKLGTGTAGAVFDKGKQTPGLKEWGKVMLDVGAMPTAEKYPSGVANLYLSKRTMPSIGKNKKHMFNRGTDADSAEMGLSLEVNVNLPKYKKQLAPLVMECGLNHYGTKDSMKGIGVEALREVLDNGIAANPIVFDEIQRDLGGLGNKVQEKLKVNVEGFWGKHRLMRLLDCSGDDVETMTTTAFKTKFEEFKQKSTEAAEQMGIFIGDFIVLLHDLYGLENYILSGGVLSGQTGTIAFKYVVKRLNKYFHVGKKQKGTKRDKKRFECKVKSPMESSISKNLIILLQGKLPKIGDYGTLGAAAFAAGQLLWEKRVEGIAKIKRSISKLQPNQRIEVEIDKIVFNKKVTFKLAEYALKGKDVNDYLLTKGPELGVFKNYEIDGNVIYMRWLVR
jgi:hypothetical protein